jgi:hypothetical protein
LQKRIDAILKTGSIQAKVSEAVPFVKKKWTSPLENMTENTELDHYRNKKEAKMRVIK